MKGAIAALLAALALIAGLWYLHHAAVERADQVGYARAVADGKTLRDQKATEALEIERGLREQIRVDTEERTELERLNAKSQSDLQRAALLGTERLRCPTPRPVQSGSTAAAGAAAGGPPADAGGEELVPDAAADVFSVGAGIARLVRKLDASNALYAKCQPLNNTP